MHEWSSIAIAAFFGITGLIEYVRRRQRQHAFRLSGILRLADRDVPMSSVREIRAESFREYCGAALVVVLRDDEEVTVTNPTPEFIAALQELRVDPNRLFRMSNSRRDDRIVLWRAGAG